MIELDDALSSGDALPRRPELLRFGWASAALQFHPVLHQDWAESEDRALRRAVMRSPALPPEVAEQLVAHRRSGMHTLGSNPAAPIELLGSNPSALRRRRAIDRAAPAGPIDIVSHPNRAELIELGSPTVDLLLAGAPALDDRHAEMLAGRTDPPADPWTIALLVARFGDRVGRCAAAHSSRARMRAADRLAATAAAWRAGEPPPGSG